MVASSFILLPPFLKRGAQRHNDQLNAIGDTALGQFEMRLTYQSYNPGAESIKLEPNPASSSKPALEVKRVENTYQVRFFNQEWKGDAEEFFVLKLSEPLATVVSEIDNQSKYTPAQLPGRIRLTSRKVEQRVEFECELDPPPNGKLPIVGAKFTFRPGEEPKLPPGLRCDIDHRGDRNRNNRLRFATRSGWSGAV